MIAPEKQIRIIKQVNKVKADVARFESDLLKLMAHPEATTEQVVECRECYLNIQDRLDDIRGKVWEATNGRVKL